MKIIFIGVGSAFTTAEYYQSNMLIIAQSGKKMLLDCGSDARFSLNECHVQNGYSPEDIDAIYISHLHADHIGGLEWLALKTYFDPKKLKHKLFMEEKLMQKMWDNSLKGGIECIEGKLMHLTDYFNCFPIADDSFFLWEGIKFTLKKMPHVMTDYKNHYSYGLLIEEPEKNGQVIFISTDTKFQPEVICDIAPNVMAIFHDCETTALKTGVHAHYDDLCSLPDSVKKKIWLYHYQPNPNYNPHADGFKGFVSKGQEFIFDYNFILV